MYYLIFDLDLGVKSFPVPSISCDQFKLQNFEIATSNGLGDDTFTRNVTDGRRTKLIYTFLKAKSGDKNMNEPFRAYKNPSWAETRFERTALLKRRYNV